MGGWVGRQTDRQTDRFYVFAYLKTGHNPHPPSSFQCSWCFCLTRYELRCWHASNSNNQGNHWRAGDSERYLLFGLYNWTLFHEDMWGKVGIVPPFVTSARMFKISTTILGYLHSCLLSISEKTTSICSGCSRLDCDTIEYCRWMPTFRRNILHPSS
jgi:hypothetical protein